MQNTREPSERGEHFGILKLLEHDLLDLERTVGKDASGRCLIFILFLKQLCLLTLLFGNKE